MDDRGEALSRGLCVGEEKTLRDLRQSITDGLGFISKRYGEVGLELGYQIRDNGALKGCQVR